MTLFTIFIIGFAASLFGGLVSGTTSLIAISSLLTIGIPAHGVLAIYRVGLLGLHLGALREYVKAKKVIWGMVVPLSLIAVAGAAIGSNIVINIDETLLRRIIGIIIPLFILVTLINSRLGVVEEEVSLLRKRTGYAAFLLTAIWTTSFAVGAGIFFVYTYMHFFGATLLQTKGTNRIPSALLDMTAIIVFALSGLINWKFALIFLAGMTVGGLLSAKIAIRIGDKWLRWILLVAITFLSVRLLLGW